ncbi:MULTISPECIES: AzlC family ABC transporter permease [unclassified Streptomyces]|uniref:AzlC family ABC transporter permease n=1 Tax=unclassified Streptomyces TaxID=2593676 RepID=UPI000823A03D|nr:AzlC family ABC transporter permease [Streptomyces sp. AmelKG-E11A]SCK62540.1 Predicted branched-chain amino acid permease (azaleucine resistance) [Streptomyces sp. AmelKG-E11A]
MAEQTAPARAGTPSPAKSDAAVVRDALGVGVAVGLSGFAFGVTAAGSGLTLLQTCALSLLVFTGASQFALVGALAAGGNPYTAAAGAFFLGVRNTFYGLRLSQLLALPRAVRPFAAHWVIDETTAVSLAQPTRRAARIGFTVTGATLYVLWNLTTLLGALGAEAIGDTDAWGLDAAGPAVFLALLAPMLTSTTERAVAALAVVIGLGLLPVLPAGVPVLLAALAAPAVLYVAGRRSPAREDTTDDAPHGTDGHDAHDGHHPDTPADPGTRTESATGTGTGTAADTGDDTHDQRGDDRRGRDGTGQAER